MGCSRSRRPPARSVARHPNSVGIEQDPASVAEASDRAPNATVVQGDFFTWASDDRRRFDCAVGNPPFIRYQRFSGATRRAALKYCRRFGVTFSGLSSSWAPFIVAAASKLRDGGRIAFVVPAEIGHAPYATPLMEYLVTNFGSVHLVAIREKIFPRLSEDCWLLFADNAGCHADGIRFSKLERFTSGEMPPTVSELISVEEWRVRWSGRLRPFLLPPHVRNLYGRLAADPGSVRLGQIARIGIGYVSGANQFFHLRPSDAQRFAIPDEFLLPSIRNSRYLTRDVIYDVDAHRNFRAIREGGRVSGDIIAVLSVGAVLAGLLRTSLCSVRQSMREQIGAMAVPSFARAGSSGSFLHQHDASSAGEHRSDAVQLQIVE